MKKRNFVLILLIFGLSAACSPATQEEAASATPEDLPPTATVSIDPSETSPLPSPPTETTVPPTAVPVQQAPPLAEVPLTFPVRSNALLAYWNSIAREEDIANCFGNFRQQCIQGVTAGRIGVGFQSWQGAEPLLESWRANSPELFAAIDVLRYNPEHGQNTPPTERDDNVEMWAQQACDYAHAHGKLIQITGDFPHNRDHIEAFAACADLIGIQGQNWQDDLDRFQNEIVGPLVARAKAANPQVLVVVQVSSTRGSAQTMLTAIKTLEGQIDGVSIWAADPSLNVLKDFVTLLRE